MSLNSVSLGNANYSNAKIAFKQDFQKSKPCFQSIQSDNNSEKMDSAKNSQKALAASLAALAGIGLGVVAAVSRKNVKKVIMNIDDFKAAGNKLIKGKAVTANGKPFTGKLVRTTKKGQNVLIEYKDGVMTSTMTGDKLKTYTRQNDKVVLTGEYKFSGLWDGRNKSGKPIGGRLFTNINNPKDRIFTTPQGIHNGG